MAFSFSRLIISESDIDTTKLAFELANTKDVEIQKLGNAACIGKVDNHKSWLGFRKGVPSWECSCMSKDVCLHEIAVAIAWDRTRNIPDPTEKDCDFLCNNCGKY